MCCGTSLTLLIPMISIAQHFLYVYWPLKFIVCAEMFTSLPCTLSSRVFLFLLLLSLPLLPLGLKSGATTASSEFGNVGTHFPCYFFLSCLGTLIKSRIALSLKALSLNNRSSLFPSLQFPVALSFPAPCAAGRFCFCPQGIPACLCKGLDAYPGGWVCRISTASVQERNSLL